MRSRTSVRSHVEGVKMESVYFPSVFVTPDGRVWRVTGLSTCLVRPIATVELVILDTVCVRQGTLERHVRKR